MTCLFSSQWTFYFNKNEEVHLSHTMISVNWELLHTHSSYLTVSWKIHQLLVRFLVTSNTSKLTVLPADWCTTALTDLLTSLLWTIALWIVLRKDQNIVWSFHYRLFIKDSVKHIIRHITNQVSSKKSWLYLGLNRRLSIPQTIGLSTERIGRF